MRAGEGRSARPPHRLQLQEVMLVLEASQASFAKLPGSACSDLMQ
jgi:hypothetical protein